jgi:hypothetical protein
MRNAWCNRLKGPKHGRSRILSEEEQWAKLRLAGEVANEVWGK